MDPDPANGTDSTFMTSKDPGQTAHLHSLSWAFTVHFMLIRNIMECILKIIKILSRLLKCIGLSGARVFCIFIRSLFLVLNPYYLKGNLL